MTTADKESAHSSMYIKSLRKALDVLEIVVQAPEGLSAQAISRELQLPYATTFRFLYTLRQEGYLTYHETQKLYRAGPALLRLYRPITQQISLGRIVYPYLAQLSGQVQETVHLAIRQSSDVVYLDTILAPGSFMMYTPVGTRAPLHATALGKVLLAFSPDVEIHNILKDYQFTKITPNTITSKEMMWQEIARIRQQGYALDEKEASPNGYCVVSVILNQSGLPEGAISVSPRRDGLTASSITQEMIENTCNICYRASLEFAAPISADPTRWYQEITQALNK